METSKSFVEARALLRHMRQELQTIYEPHEAESIARWLAEEFFGISSVDLLKGKTPDPNGFAKWKEALPLLRQHMPVQYVVGYGYFCGMRFAVGEGVLIPRPETEQLTEMAADFLTRNNLENATVADLCTGSGCIAHTLALRFAKAKIYAVDNSPQALYYAHLNARRLGAHTVIREGDVLCEALAKQLPMCDAIISNPPYVLKSERAQMHPRVTEYEPPHALFVSDEDPLLFCRAVARLAAARLKSGGWLGVEINESFGKAAAELFRAAGFTEVAVVKDFHGKDRFVTARAAF